MTANIRWLAAVARPELGRTVAAGLVGSSAQLCAIALAGTAGWLIARAAEQPPVLALTVAVTAVRAFGIGRGVLRYAERLIGHDAAFRLMGRTRLRVYRALERSGPANSQQVRQGSLLTRLLDDVQAVQDLLVRGALPALVLFFGTVASTIGLAMLAPAFGWVLAIGMVLAGGGAAVVAARSAVRVERRSSRAREDLAVPTIEVLRGLAELEAHGATSRWLERVARADARFTASERRAADGSGLADAVVLLALGATVLTELLFGIAAVRSGAMPASWLPVVVLVPIAVFELAAWVPELVRHLAVGWGAVGRLRRLDELPPAPVGSGVLAVARPLPQMRVTGLSVRWPAATFPTLVDVSLSLSPGKRIGVVGGSGVGKTTLLNAMLGFLPAERGAIRLDGVALPDLAEESLRRSIACCGQDAQLFDNTIRNNLALACPGVEDARLYDVLRRVRLLDWVASLPNGLDSTVGERGVRVSGGERQRLALARALLANPSILLLDEPTAYLDEPTAAELMRDLLVVTAGRSTVLVTHRLAGLSVVDEIIVLGSMAQARDTAIGAASGTAIGAGPAVPGRQPSTVIQRGTPTELMQTPGPYRSMWFRAASSASSLSGLPVDHADARY